MTLPDSFNAETVQIMIDGKAGTHSWWLLWGPLILVLEFASMTPAFFVLFGSLEGRPTDGHKVHTVFPTAPKHILFYPASRVYQLPRSLAGSDR